MQTKQKLARAKANPNDELFTLEKDILNELSYWAKLGKFKDKNIICPCDNYASNFVKVLEDHKKEWKIKSIKCSCYNPNLEIGTRFQDIDFSKYDICITNPPFSRYKEFSDAIIGKIDFVVLAPFLNRVTPSVGLPLMLKKAYLGHGIHLPLKFISSGGNYKAVACDWLVSYPDAQEERNKKHYKTGIKNNDYPVMSKLEMKDGTFPIKVGTEYPDNYTGWMFGGVNVLDKLDLSKYKWFGTHFNSYYHEDMTRSPFKYEMDDKKMMVLNNKVQFHGIVFKRK